MTCSECRWFASEMSRGSVVRWPNNSGECRRYAPRGPVVMPLNAKGAALCVISGFAPVPPDDWCGEFEPKEAA